VAVSASMSTKPLFFALVMAALGVASCGGNGDGPKTVDLGEFIVPDFSEKPDLSKVCISSCTSDIQCQNSCAAPSSGISCCDTSTQMCYTSSASVCPAPPDMAIQSSY